VDKTRFGVTGRSGGGAYSWWIAALDERIKCAVPVAGITDLQNHVVDGCVEGHCDCMYMVNTYRWDYPQVAALVAPRPLLIANTDTDGIFPLDGVYRTFEQVRRIYRLHEPAEKGVSAKVALNIAAGPHKDTQELQTAAFRWFNHHLKGDDSLIDTRAPKMFAPEQLKVFGKLPEDQINTRIHETFVAKASPPQVPADKAAWEKMRDGWLKSLKEKSIRRNSDDAPQDPFEPHKPPLQLSKGAEPIDLGGIRHTVYHFEARPGTTFSMRVLHRSDLQRPELTVLNLLDEQEWQEFMNQLRAGSETESSDSKVPPSARESWDALQKMLTQFPWAMAYLRLGDATPFDQTDRKQVQNRRRLYLLGQTQEETHVWVVRRTVQAVRQIEGLSQAPLWLQSHRTMAGVALYASLFEPDIKRLDLYDLPKSHRDGPYFLNVERYLDMPQAVAMAAERSKVVLYQNDDAGWEYPQAVAKNLGWDAKQIQIRRKPGSK
jgi:hypothetical protein